MCIYLYIYNTRIIGCSHLHTRLCTRFNSSNTWRTCPAEACVVGRNSSQMGVKDFVAAQATETSVSQRCRTNFV